jgi:hypothetical protein
MQLGHGRFLQRLPRRGTRRRLCGRWAPAAVWEDKMHFFATSARREAHEIAVSRRLYIARLTRGGPRADCEADRGQGWRNKPLNINRLRSTVRSLTRTQNPRSQPPNRQGDAAACLVALMEGSPVASRCRDHPGCFRAASHLVRPRSLTPLGGIKSPSRAARIVALVALLTGRVG